MNENKILGIFKRTEPEPHYEVHFDKHVEFWTLEGKKLGESKVEEYVG
jgi:hypothetical protein